MEDTYYSLPLRLDQIMEKRQAPRCSAKESIAQHIHLVLTTYFNENRFDPTYGCGIWEQDFELVSNLQWKDQTRDHIKKSVELHEKRLNNIQVKVEVDEHELGGKNIKRIKRRVSVIVEGSIKRTNEKFAYKDEIYISPLSLD
jgi:phage baseplate assembly protein W